MQEDKEKIVQLAIQIAEKSVAEQDKYIEGVAQANSAFAYAVLKAYHDCEFQLSLLLRAG